MAENTDGTGGMDAAKLIELIKGLGDEERKAVVQGLKIGEDGNASVKEAEDIAKYSKEHLETLKQTASLLNDMQAMRKADVAIAKQAFLQRVEESAQEDMKEEKRKLALKYFEALESGEKSSIKNAKEKLDMDEEEIKALEEKVFQNKAITEAQKEFGKDQRKVLGGIASALGMTKTYKSTFIGAIVEMNKGLGSKEPEKRKAALDALAENFEEFFNLQNLALAVFGKIYESSMKVFKDFDKAQASLAAATGQGREFNSVLYDVQRNANLYGVSMDEAGKAIGELVNQTSYFTSMSKAQKVEIAETVAKMNKLGVSTADSAAIFQNFNQGLGIAGDKAIKMQRDLAMAGVGIGIDAQKITKDFNASLKTLMVYGEGSIDVFKGLSAAAKAAGVEVSTLLTLAGKFDTFQGAAETVGKMNALLGTQLSTTQMLMMTEDERIRTLVESVQAQGIAFKDMDRFTQKAIANAAGITDMAEANRIFGMSLAEYDENERKLKASADAQKKFDDAVGSTVQVMDKFKLLGAEIIVALEPFFETISETADALTDWFSRFSKEEKERLGTILLVLSGFALLIPIFAVGGALMSGLGTLAMTLLPLLGTGAATAAPGITALGASMGALGAGVASTIGPIAALVFGIAAVAGGLAIMYYGVGSVIEAFTELLALIGSGFTWMFGVDDQASEKMSEIEARTAEAMASIVSVDSETAMKTVKGLVGEINKIGEDVKVRSTIENLALITAGKSTDMTGDRVVASNINVTSNISNSFDGVKVLLEIGGEKIEGVIADISAKTQRGEV
jgi:hypothetical protein